MSKQMPIVLHVCEYDPNPLVATTVAQLNGEVVLAHTLMDALAMYTFYVPDIVLVEAPMGSWVAQESLFHLDSVDARPLVILTDRRDIWNTEAVVGVHIRPLDIGENALLGTLARALGLHPAWA
jgi:hypothetical protein